MSLTVQGQSLDGWQNPSDNKGRVLVRTRSVSGIEAVDVHAGTGVVALQGAADQAELLVSVRLTENEAALQPGAVEAGRTQASAAIAAARLEVENKGSWLYLEVRYPTATDPTLVREQWTVTLPPGIDAEVEMAAGRLYARDVDGRLDLHLGVGTIRASTRGPGIDARVSYGDASIDAFASSPGRLSAMTGTGNARVTLDGVVLPLRRPLPGAVVVGNAGGHDDYIVRSEVGSVELSVRRLTPEGDEVPIED
ncbi:MAG: hypothetical protein AAGA68_19010 [Pseudomonadota bacterium]